MQSMYFAAITYAWGFPFEIVRYKPNTITQAAIREAEQLLNDPNAKTFTSMEALRADLLSDEADDVWNTK